MRRTRRLSESQKLSHQAGVVQHAPRDRSGGVRGRIVPMTALSHTLAQRPLNPIVFPQQLVMEGVTLATLVSLPRQELVGLIPDYHGLRVGDRITALIHNRAMRKTAVAGEICVCDGVSPLNVRYDRHALEQFGQNGRLEFSYEIRSATGDVTLRSPPTTLPVMMHGMPERLRGPLVVCAADGMVRETEMIPELIVYIPASEPRCAAGDRVRLRIGDAWFAPVELGEADVASDPMAKLQLPCDDILRLLAETGQPRIMLEASYEVERHGTLSPSEVAVVAFDLSALCGA